MLEKEGCCSESNTQIKMGIYKDCLERFKGGMKAILMKACCVVKYKACYKNVKSLKPLKDKRHDHLKW